MRLILSNGTIGTYKIHCIVLNGSIHSNKTFKMCRDVFNRIKHTYSRMANTLIEYLSNTIFPSMLEHNTSMMGSMKSIIGKKFWKFSKTFWANF